jgi:hypothetical protein
VTGVHFAVTERKKRGAHKGMGNRFLKKHPDATVYFSERSSSLYRVVLGETECMVNRAWAFQSRISPCAFNRWPRCFTSE